MSLVVSDDGWRIPDEVWAEMEPLLPPRPAHPLGCHNPRVPDRDEKLLRATIESIPITLPDDPELDCGVCLDKGYDYSEVYELLAEFGFTAHVRSRKQEAEAIKHEAGFRAR